MPKVVTLLWKRISTTVAGFTFAQKTLVILAVLVLGLGIFGLTAWLTRPDYVPLFSGISASDASAISDQLHTDNVPYQLSDGGSTILVPESDVYSARLKAASAGLPSAPNQGYSLLNKLGVTASQFQQNVTYQEAMEGELANTIDAMTGVSNADVKLAIPQPTVFTDKTQDPTASVFVQLDPGTRLSQSQVQAIVHLVSASIVGMKSTDVSVVDQKGDVLSTVGGGPVGGTNTQTATYDRSAQSSVQSMLDQVLGPGNSTVVVNAVLNPATATKTTKTQTVPPGAPSTSASEQKETYSGTGQPSSAAGLLGTTTQTTGGGTPGKYTSTDVTKDNALNTTTLKQSIPSGAVTRQSVSVAVSRAAAAKNGVTAPQLKKLVAAAAGVNAKRGDTISVQLVNFSTANAAAAKLALAQAAAQARAQRLQQWIKDGGIIAAILVAGLLAGLIIRRALRETTPEEPTEGEGLFQLPPGDHPLPEFAATPATPTTPTPQASATDGSLDYRRRREEIEAMAERDPKRAAEYLRGLMDDRSGT